MHIFIAFYLLYNAIKGSKKFLYIAAFLIPLQALSVDFLATFSWYKLIFPIGLIAILISYLATKQQIRTIKVPGINIFVLYFVYIILLTGIWWWMDSINCYSDMGVSLGWGPAQSTYRYPVQLISYIFVWGLVLTGIWFTRSFKDLESLINGYIAGNIFSIVFGFYQMLAIPLGLPWFYNIEYNKFLTEGLANRVLLSNLGLPFKFYRLYGLGGEPKHTASFAVIAFALLLSYLLFPKKIKINRPGLKLAIIVLGILATASTGGWIALGLISVYFAILIILTRPKKILLYLIPIVIIFFVIVGIFGSQVIVNIFEQRFLSRVSNLDNLIKNEPKDGALIRYAQEYPENQFFGHGAGGIDFWIIPYTNPIFLSYGGTITPAYLPTRLLGDVGLVGILFIFILWLRWILFLKKHKNKAGMHFCIIGAVSLAIVSQVGLGGYLLICSSMVAATTRGKSEFL